MFSINFLSSFKYISDTEKNYIKITLSFILALVIYNVITILEDKLEILDYKKRKGFIILKTNLGPDLCKLTKVYYISKFCTAKA